MPFNPVCNAWYACLIAPKSAAGKIPFAAAKAPALTKLRKCVTGDKIVFASVGAGMHINAMVYEH